MATLDQAGTAISVEEIHLALLQALPDGMCFMDLRGAIRFWNDAAEDISGFSVAEAVCARHCANVFFLSDPTGRPVSVNTDLATDPATVDFFLRHKDGHAVPISVRRLAVRGQNSLPVGTLFLFTVSEGTFQVDALEAGADARPAWLRGVAVLQPLQWLHGANRPAGILLIQIDGFENLEQRLGPEAAEKVFSLVERTTANCLKTDETCQRLPGGLILASTRSLALLRDLAERVRSLIESSHVQWWGEAVSITVSIGATAVGPHDAVADAVRRAEDFALRVSSAGGNKVALDES